MTHQANKTSPIETTGQVLTRTEALEQIEFELEQIRTDERNEGWDNRATLLTLAGALGWLLSSSNFKWSTALFIFLCLDAIYNGVRGIKTLVAWEADEASPVARFRPSNSLAQARFSLVIVIVESAFIVSLTERFGSLLPFFGVIAIIVARLAVLLIVPIILVYSYLKLPIRSYVAGPLRNLDRLTIALLVAFIAGGFGAFIGLLPYLESPHFLDLRAGGLIAVLFYLVHKLTETPQNKGTIDGLKKLRKRYLLGDAPLASFAEHLEETLCGKSAFELIRDDIKQLLELAKQHNHITATSMGRWREYLKKIPRTGQRLSLSLMNELDKQMRDLVRVQSTGIRHIKHSHRTMWWFFLRTNLLATIDPKGAANARHLLKTLQVDLNKCFQDDSKNLQRSQALASAAKARLHKLHTEIS